MAQPGRRVRGAGPMDTMRARKRSAQNRAPGAAAAPASCLSSTTRPAS